MRVSLNWLKDFVATKEALDKVRHALTMAGLEVISILNIENDHVMDIEITPNRPDCLSILGVARELAAAIERPLKAPLSVKTHYMKKGPARGGAKIGVLDKKGCPRYAGCVIKNIKVGPSPKWLVERLNAIGVRSVNNIVDITNFVLFELGQPLHAFDLDKLRGKRIIVRKAKKGERLVTIDGVERVLDPGMLVIADIERPVAIAGIMGGKDTEISDTTKNILLESAYFEPSSIRKAQRMLGLASESSYRFERGVDFGMVLSASTRAQEMIKEIAGGRVQGKVADIGGRIIKEKELTLSVDEIPRVLGIEIGLKEIMNFFKRLNLKPFKKGRGKVLVKIPSYRQDLERDIDLVEEITRLYGYDKIPTKYPLFKIQKTYEAEKKELVSLQKEAREILCSLGINEIVTYALTSRNAIEALGWSLDNVVRLANPLSSNQEVMRPTLLSEILEVLSWNLNRNNAFLQLFELNKIYIKDKETIQERLNLSIGMSGVMPGNWKDKPREIDLFDLKGVVGLFLDSLGIKNHTIEKSGTPIFKEALSASIKVDGIIVGSLGEAKQEVLKKFGIKEKAYLAEISMEDVLKYANLTRRFTPLDKYPSIKRDISILVDDSVSASSIYDVIKEEGGSLIKSINIFDLYRGQQIEEGKKSLGYTIEFRSEEKTLKEEEISHIYKDIQEALIKKLGAQIR